MCHKPRISRAVISRSKRCSPYKRILAHRVGRVDFVRSLPQAAVIVNTGNQTRVAARRCADRVDNRFLKIFTLSIENPVIQRVGIAPYRPAVTKPQLRPVAAVRIERKTTHIAAHRAAPLLRVHCNPRHMLLNVIIICCVAAEHGLPLAVLLFDKQLATLVRRAV